MKAVLTVFLFTVSLFAFSASASPVETYEFQDKESQERYNQLIKELRCPKCQNQNLADSNSQIAVDLRQEVFEMVQQGKSEPEVADFMVERYGEFVLYRPKVSKLTYILWFGPAAFLLIGVIIVVFVLRQKKTTKHEPVLTSSDKSKLENILKDK